MALGSRITLVIVCVALLVCASAGWAQNPITNPSFENDLTGWTSYSYIPQEFTDPADPIVGCVGSEGCAFTYTNPPPAPDGTNVCGIQCVDITGNGGVCQTFEWTGGPAVISVGTYACSYDYSNNPLDNGSRVRIGLANGATQDQTQVASWVESDWGADWSTTLVPIPEPGTYTLFIESYQPTADGYSATLWDNIQFSNQQISITSGPTITLDAAHPENVATVTWTTDVPSDSRIDFGATTNYGHSAADSSLVTEHSLTVTNLTHSAAYHYRVTSAARGHTDAVSSDAIFRTPIYISSISASAEPDRETVDVVWQTDVDSTSQVEYWPEVSLAHSFTSEDTTLSSSHQVTVTMGQGVYYSYRVWSRRAGYSDAVSPVQKFFLAPQIGSTLLNGSFDDTLGGAGILFPWVQYTPTSPSFNPIDGLIGQFPSDGEAAWAQGIKAFEGNYFIGAASNWGYKNGGVWQSVSVTPGEYYTLTAHYITDRSGGQDGYEMIRLGIDPDGGTNATAPGIQWWNGFSDTNDTRWHTASVTAMAGSSGVVTVFLDFYQRYAIQWHASAIDDVTLEQPQIRAIGALNALKGNMGAILQNETVTCVCPDAISYGGSQYKRVYVEADNRGAGIAVLLPVGQTDVPEVGNKITVTGAVAVAGRELALVAAACSIDHSYYSLPGAFAINQHAICAGSLEEPPLLGKLTGLCNVGLRVRLCGTVTNAQPPAAPGDVVAYIDDGSGISDPSGYAGIKCYLPDSPTGVSTGDQIIVTGVLGTEFVDPDNWPDPTDYYTYCLTSATPDDWVDLSAAPPSSRPPASASRR